MLFSCKLRWKNLKSFSDNAYSVLSDIDKRYVSLSENLWVKFISPNKSVKLSFTINIV